MADRWELHFQEGFTGEGVEVRVDGSVVESFEARTRMQTGKARVLRLDLEAGQAVSIALVGGGPAGSFPVRGESPYVRINLVDGDLVIEPGKDMPRYA